MKAENPFFSPEGLTCFNVRSSFGFSFLFILVFNFLTVYYLCKLHFYLIPSAHISWSSFLSNHSYPHHVCFCWCGSCASGHSCCMFMTAMAMSHSEDSILQDSSPPSISHNPASHFPQCALRLLHIHLCSCDFSPFYFGCIIWGITISLSKIVTGLSVPSSGLPTGVYERSRKSILMYELEGCWLWAPKAELYYTCQ